MHDEQGWNWDRPFDEDFVASATAREESGQARAEKAARIAAQHRVSDTWRGEGVHLDTRQRESPAGRRRPRQPRRSSRACWAVLAMLLVAALAVGLGFFDSTSSGRTTLREPVTGGEPPVPPDALSARILPLPAQVPGTGGYRMQAYGAPAGSVRWDPCRPVHYVMRLQGMPPGGSALVQDAFDALSVATGLQFVPDGATTEGPNDERSPVQPDRYGNRWAPVLISWSGPGEAPLLAGGTAAYAGAQPFFGAGGSRLVTGSVVLEAAALTGMSPAQRRGVVLHELGHLVGLDHVTDRGELMHSESAATGLTPGAQRGLRLAGDGACFR